MKKSKKITLIIYFVAFVLPILGMMNCSGWDEGSMTVSSCIIDGIICRGYANFYYALLLFSSFALLIPVGIYAGIVIFFTKLISKRIDKTEQK